MVSFFSMPLSWWPGFARIAEVLDLKGLRAGMNRQDTQRVSLTQEGNDKTHIERARRLMTNCKILFFSASFIQKRKRLKHQNTLT
jgi:hypothetical protein